jgi:alpha-glucosidase
MADLEALDLLFTEHAFPCDGLWLDIDYMRGYRVFTFEQNAFDEPQRQIRALRARGRHVVPILDPGVKVDKDYAIDRDGITHGIFSLNSNGDPYVGFVWPGASHFPDFSLQKARSWWAGHVRALVRPF